MARRTYTAEFRHEAVRLVRDGKRRIASAARELGIGPQTLSSWLKQAEVDEGRGPHRVHRRLSELSLGLLNQY